MLSDGGNIHGWREEPLQHLPLDRLLQDGDLAELIVDVGLVAGDEDKGTPRSAGISATAEIDVEDGGVEITFLRSQQRLLRFG